MPFRCAAPGATTPTARPFTDAFGFCPGAQRVKLMPLTYSTPSSRQLRRIPVSRREFPMLMPTWLIAMSRL